ncbi:phage major capsid protein [Burkholderia contaminans]|uniref:phage major capsid protein n=1 Tax=Burkholderia contaminans TaxID=488447 RepID=UPI00158878BF|nr:phage major capsid protein [Burkholderia contaminans]
MTKKNNAFIRSVIADVVAGPAGAATYAEARWGVDAGATQVVKALTNPMLAGPEAKGALTAGTLSRQEFVQAVFSRSILGQLKGLVQVPAICRVNAETSQIAARFVGEYMPLPTYRGAFTTNLVDKRKVGLVAVMSRELFRMTGDAAEGVISAQLKRALSRGLDNYFVGEQGRDDSAPAGLASLALKASTFADGINMFAGDLTTSSILVNPRTAIALRSPTETRITASGGEYGGLPAIASYGVPQDKLFIVDASRVLAYIGDVEMGAGTTGRLNVDDGSGTTSQVYIDLFSTDQVAVKAEQYADWDFVDGAAVEVTFPF